MNSHFSGQFSEFTLFCEFTLFSEFTLLSELTLFSELTFFCELTFRLAMGLLQIEFYQTNTNRTFAIRILISKARRTFTPFDKFHTRMIFSEAFIVFRI